MMNTFYLITKLKLFIGCDLAEDETSRKASESGRRGEIGHGLSDSCRVQRISRYGRSGKIFRFG